MSNKILNLASSFEESSKRAANDIEQSIKHESQQLANATREHLRYAVHTLQEDIDNLTSEMQYRVNRSSQQIWFRQVLPALIYTLFGVLLTVGTWYLLQNQYHLVKVVQAEDGGIWTHCLETSKSGWCQVGGE